MKCPECKITKRGRPDEYTMPELFDHMLDRHPSTLINTARTLLKEQAVELTDVEYKEADKNGA